MVISIITVNYYMKFNPRSLNSKITIEMSWANNNTQYMEKWYPNSMLLEKPSFTYRRAWYNYYTHVGDDAYVCRYLFDLHVYVDLHERLFTYILIT